MSKLCEWKSCTGCHACSNVCPKEAIKMDYNESGILIPYIDTNTCVNCGLCTKVCPVLNPIVAPQAKRAFAAWNLDDKKRISSTSGGLAATFYEYMYNQGGICFGTKFDDELNLKIVSAESYEDILAFKGSKYVQALVGDSFKSVKKYLEENKRVLYIGTPCQIVGLRNYLRRDYTNLITVDLICHGVPSQLYLKEHVAEINKKIKRKITRIAFRDSLSYELALYEGEEKVYRKERYLDSYLTGFANGLFHRPNCYECVYACDKRMGDLTIGDFWGLGNELPCDYKSEKGISLVIPNTEKGMKFFDEVKSHLFVDERPISEAISGNTQLRHPSEKHDRYQLFSELYITDGFEVAASKCTEKEITEYKKNIKVSIYKRIFRKIKRVLKL